jgi:hypothetical protein
MDNGWQSLPETCLTTILISFCDLLSLFRLSFDLYIELKTTTPGKRNLMVE